MGGIGVGSEDVDFANATGFADGDNTTQLIGAGSFVTGDGLEANPSDTITFTEEALSETEIEVALIVNGSQVSVGDSIQLRLLYSDGDASPPATVLGSYTNTPTLTVAAIRAERGTLRGHMRGVGRGI